MTSQICFTEPSGRQRCFPLYVEIRKFPPKPDPDPWKRKTFEWINDHFSEVTKDGIIKKELVTDLAILSAISQLSKELSPEFAKGFQENLKSVNKQLNLENEAFKVKIG